MDRQSNAGPPGGRGPEPEPGPPGGMEPEQGPPGGMDRNPGTTLFGERAYLAVLSDEDFFHLERSIRKEKLRRTRVTVPDGNFHSEGSVRAREGTHAPLLPTSGSSIPAPDGSITAPEGSIPAPDGSAPAPELSGSPPGVLFELETLLIRAARICRQRRERQGAAELAERILLVVHSSHAPSATEIGRIVGRALPAVSRALARLESSRLIYRTVYPGDRRVRRVRTTPAGSSKAETLLITRGRRLRDLFHTLSGADVRELRRLLEKL